MSEDTEIPPDLQEIRFTNRRRMAWASWFVLVIIGAGLLLFGLSADEYAKRVETLSFVSGTLMTILGGIIAAYYGVSAWVNVARGK